MLNKINKLMRLPEKIACDKRLHFLVGVVFTMIVMVMSTPFIASILLPIYAWGIEIYQRVTKSGTYDNYDAIAVVLGGVTVMLPYLIKGI